MKEEIKKYMPPHVDLYYVDYDTNLKESASLLQACISDNSLMPISESIYDWWDFPETYYLNEIREQMASDGMLSEFDDNYDDILDYLRDHDESTPIKDLLRNTGNVSCFYDLGLELDCGYHYDFMCSPWRNESINKCVYKVCQKLGIKKSSPEAAKIQEVVENAAYGGDLRIYFQSDIQSLISGHQYESIHDNKEDFQQIRFKGRVALAVYEPTEGSGDFVEIDIDRSFPFLRDNLVISSTEKYSLERCFGMDRDWSDGYAKPQLSMEPLKGKRTIKKSSAAELRERESELNKVFKAGGCTHGDMDITRHRDVYYDNSFPCGSRCPHCNTFWID